jgi:hypothetical protein
MMKLSSAIALAIAVIAFIAVIAVLAFLVMLCQSCGYRESGRTIAGPSQWYNYSVENASYVVLDINCHTLGENEINIVKASDPGVIRVETVHKSMVMTRTGCERYGEAMQVGISSSYASDMYYGGARINVYLPDGPIYDIKVDTTHCYTRIANLTGTNLVVNNRYSGDLIIDGGNYDYVYASNAGKISGRFLATNSTLISGSGNVNVVTSLPA